VRGHSYPWRGVVLVPTYHPAAVLRGGPSALAEMRADLVRAKLALSGAGAAPVPVPAPPPRAGARG
jgi:uracil-DNA glycosylase